MPIATPSRVAGARVVAAGVAPRAAGVAVFVRVLLAAAASRPASRSAAAPAPFTAIVATALLVAPIAFAPLAAFVASAPLVTSPAFAPTAALTAPAPFVTFTVSLAVFAYLATRYSTTTSTPSSHGLRGSGSIRGRLRAVHLMSKAGGDG